MVKVLKKITLLASQLFVISCGGPVTKFDWLASDSAPANYPMHIVSGTFHAPDGYSLYIPDKRNMNPGWGNIESMHVVGPDLKSLPNRLEITYFSYAEDKFYQGEFDLPYERILSLFQEGHLSYRNWQPITYSFIVCGVAPGGHVVVWVQSVDRSVEVFRGVAKEADIDWSVITKNPDVTRQGRINEILDRSMDAQARQQLKDSGVPYGLWEKYRTRYLWRPTFVNIDDIEAVAPIMFYNGEKDSFDLRESIVTEPAQRPVPSYLNLSILTTSGRYKSLTIYFNEEEIFDAFEELTLKEPDPQKSIDLVVAAVQVDGTQSYQFSLRKGDTHYVLKKANYEFLG